jgi:NhaA family Na+:H+ antiporter
MKSHAASPGAWEATALAERYTTRAAAFVLEHHLLVAVGAAIALVWANTRPESYFSFAHALRFPVNQIGMALFVALITQEVLEATMKGGPLHTWRRWSVPAIAAMGGFLLSAVVYRRYVVWRTEPIFEAAWPAATAIDLVFAYVAARLIFGRRHPAVAFVLVTAIATTAFGMLAVGFAGTPFRASPGAAMLLIAALAIAYGLKRMHVRSFWPYLLVAGGPSWLALYLGGVHPALALVPIVPFLPRRPRSLEHFADTPETGHGSPRHFEYVWTQWVEGVLFLFALVNAGVIFAHYGSASWAVAIASTMARPIGILAGVGLAASLGFALPPRMHARDLIVIALVCSVGFTFTLFLATGIFPSGPLLSQIRIGALVSSGGLLLALLAAWFFGVGRFRPQISRGAL